MLRIKTVIQEKVEIWQDQVIWVEVESMEQFEELKRENRLSHHAEDWADANFFFETIKTLEEDNQYSEILEKTEIEK